MTVDVRERGRPGLTLLGPKAELPPHLVPAHALKNCLSTLDAVGLLLGQCATGVTLEWARQASALVHRAQQLVETQLSGSLPALAAEDWPAELVVRTAIARVRARAEAGRVDVQARYDRARLRGDGEALALALENLLMNAIEASTESDVVSVTARLQPCGNHCWTVEDRGRGMDEKTLVGLGVSRGLRPGGLAVAREIVEAHGGLLRVESAPGAGTLVALWLPARA